MADQQMADGRWEANTVVDGKNVGGKFKPKKGDGIKKAPEDEKVDTFSPDAIIERVRKISEQPQITPEDAVEVVRAHGEILDGSSPEVRQHILKQTTEDDFASQAALVSEMYGIEVPLSAEVESNMTGRFENGAAKVLAETIQPVDPGKPDFGGMIGNLIPLVTTELSMLWPEMLIGLVVGQTIPFILVAFFSHQAIAALADRTLGKVPEDNPVQSIVRDLALLALSGGIAKGLLKISAKTGLSDVVSKTAKSAIESTKKTIIDTGIIDQAIKTPSIQEIAKRGSDVEAVITKILQSSTAKEVGRTSSKQQLILQVDLASKAAANPAEAHLFQRLAAYTAAGKAVPTTQAVQQLLRNELTDKQITPALKAVGIDPQQLSTRLLEMAEVDKIPLQYRHARMEEIQRLIGRIKELPRALSVSEKIDADKLLEVFKKDLDAARKNLPTDEYNGYALEAETEFGKMLEKSHGVKWRASVIQSEIAHGEHLDRLLHSAQLSEAAGHHDKLLNTLKRHDEIVKKEFVGGNRLQEYLSNRFGVKKAAEVQSRHYKSGLIQGPIDTSAASEAIDLINRISVNPIKSELTIAMTPGTRAFTNGSFIELGSASARHIWHETGHIIEKENPEIYYRMSAFRSERAKALGHAVADMGAKGLRGEKTLVDHFSREYNGKIYPLGGRATEMMSTGVESLASVEKTIAHLQQDREHMLLTLGALSQPIVK